MPLIAKTDITQLVKNLVAVLNPLANEQGIQLLVPETQGKQEIACHAEQVLISLTTVLCRILEHLPVNKTVYLSVHKNEKEKALPVQVLIRVNGFSLGRVESICKDCQLPVFLLDYTGNRTDYTLTIREYATSGDTAPGALVKDQAKNSTLIPGFYAEIRKRLRSHFKQSDNLVTLLSRHKPKEAAFLKKVNEVIENNIDNSAFDTNSLSDAMYMSRVQLFRKLKPIIRQSPGHYIRTIRLQKAKELLETTDSRICEVAFKTGFETPSHFTRAFIKHFGIKPSLFSRRKEEVTK